MVGVGVGMGSDTHGYTHAGPYSLTATMDASPTPPASPGDDDDPRVSQPQPSLTQ